MAFMQGNVLAGLAGEWMGEETLATTRWGQGGAATGRIRAAFDLDGRVLLLDYRQQRDGKPALRAHAVFAAGQEQGEHALYWFDSDGFMPWQPATGHWDGKRLVFLRSSQREQTRHVYEWIADGLYRLLLERSSDAGVNWERVMEGEYRRLGEDA
jgi:hypothetical protein